MIAKQLTSFGKLNNFARMPEIAEEVVRQFNLDHIGVFSCQYCVSKGAIKGHFNILKSIWRFQNL